jgi:hypothetical protein
MQSCLAPVSNIFAVSSTAVPTSSAVNTASTAGMTTGAKIGASVGAICGFAFVGFLLYFLAFLLKRRTQEKYNAERVARIQAKAERTFSSDNTPNGSFDRLGSGGVAAAFNISRTATPNSTIESLRRPLPPLPPQYDTISPQESYAPYRQLSDTIAHELRNLEPLAIAQHAQLPSHYSFSGPPVTSPISPTEGAPSRRMSPVQEFAAAQLPSHYSFSGPPAISPVISPIEGHGEGHGRGQPWGMTPVQEYAAAQLPSHYSFSGSPPTIPVSPIEDPNRRPARQEIAAAQLPSHYSFSGPPSGYVRPADIPERKLTPAQELASARLRSNMSPMGLAGIGA